MPNGLIKLFNARYPYYSMFDVTLVLQKIINVYIAIQKRLKN